MPKQHMTIPIFVPHLGCPHRCLFCNQWSASGAKNVPDRETVARAVDEYRSTAAPGTETELAFFGGSFTAIERGKQTELLSAAHEQKKKGTIRAIRLSTRPDCISAEALDLLCRYEVDTVELGAQSFHDDVLEAAGRGHSAEDTLNAAGMIRSRGMGLVIQLMPGLPRDTAEKSVASARQAADLAPDAVRIYPTVVIRGTGLEKMWQCGEYVPLSLEAAVAWCADQYSLFAAKNIPVIRMGLHPFSPDEASSILAGPYHPAFGFMVKARTKRAILEKSLRDFLRHRHGGNPGRLMLHLPHNGIEEYIGHRRENIRYLEQLFDITGLEYRMAETKEAYYSVKD